VIDDWRYLDALGDELHALLRGLFLAARLEGEVIHALGHAEWPVEAAVELDRNALDPARLHEGQELLLPRVEEHVAELTAFLHGDDVATDHLEAKHALVEGARHVHV
jgi:hypothetical protein